MAIGDALSKIWTYGTIIENGKLRSGTVTESRISPTLARNIVSMNVQKVAKRLVDSGGYYASQYLVTNSVLTISGSANPYTVNLSGLAPFLDKPQRVVHVTTGGVRTLVQILDSEEAEQIQGLTNTFASSIFGLYMGDSLRLYKGSAFTITTSTDTIEFQYFRQAKIGSVSTTSVVSDTAYTIASDGITVSDFTGTLTSHVGGILVGKDNAGNPFAKTIVQYVSATSFIVDSAIAGVGASTNGYLIPPGVSTYTVTDGTYIDVPDSFAELVMTLTAADFARLKDGGKPDTNLESQGLAQLDSIYKMGAIEKSANPKGE